MPNLCGYDPGTAACHRTEKNKANQIAIGARHPNVASYFLKLLGRNTLLGQSLFKLFLRGPRKISCDARGFLNRFFV